MKALTSLAALALLALLSPMNVAAQAVPLAISYQAVLTDDAENPLSPTSPKNYSVIFRIYDAVEDGTLLWAESQTVSVYQGSFSTLLGTGGEVMDEAHSQLDTIFDGSLRFLAITVTEGGADKTFTPRQRMVSVPFAFRSKVAEQAITIVDNSIGTAQLANRSVTAAKMDADSVSAYQLQANSVGASEITANAVGASELANGAVDIAALAAAVQNQLVPAGTVVAWAGNLSKIPAGWLLCDGSEYNPNLYPKLREAIEFQYRRNGTFWTLPDYRGYFLRADALNTGRDPDRNSRMLPNTAAPGFSLEGSSQGGQFTAHNHKDGIYDRLSATAGRTGHAHTYNGNGDYSPSEMDLVESGLIKSAGGNETRPINKYVHYIIKAH